MKIIAYLDNDKLNKPDTGSSPVYALDEPGPVSAEQLLSKYPRVFGPGVGLLEGKYRIRLDGSVAPVQHPPRRVPVPLREALKGTLDDLVEQDILAPVQEPTSWVSSTVVVPKEDGKLHICLDPRDLNKAIRHEHYPLPTIDVATWLYGSQCWMCERDSGTWSWKKSPFSPPSTHRLGGTDGRGRPLVSVQPQKCSSDECISSSRASDGSRWLLTTL